MLRLFLVKKEHEKLGNDLQISGICEDFRKFEKNEDFNSNDGHEDEMLEMDQDGVSVMPLVKYQALMPPSSENEHSEKDLLLNESSYTNNTVSGIRKNCSPMWLCAVRLSQDLAECKICKVKISFKGGNRQNVRNHLIHHHSDDKNVIEMKRLFIENNLRKRSKNESL